MIIRALRKKTNVIELTAERLREVLAYDPETGAFSWKVARGPNRAGGPAGNVNKVIGYLQIRIDYVLYYGQRLAWLYMTGAWPGKDIDHRDADKTNNRFENLREATMSQNIANSGMFAHNKSGLKGVSWYKPSGKWCAKIKIMQKSYNLGYFDCPAAAHFAYIIAADKAFGEFARSA